MTHVILSGKRVDADLEAAPVGAFDVIRDDLRMISTVRPIDRVFVERTETGYRGVLFSKEKPYIFALNGNGFSAKAVEDSVQVLGYCNRLEDGERRITSTLDARRSDNEIDEFNQEMFDRPTSDDDATVQLEAGPPATLMVSGPPPGDPIERVPGAYRKMMQGASISRMEGKEVRGVCGGGIVLNKEGKVLLVKPRNGFGGYDWTFPKGYPVKQDGVLAQTAVREVREETGYRVFSNRLLGRFTHNDGGVCDYFYCDIDSSKPVGKYDEFETAAVRWASLNEALEMLNDDVDVRILAQANNLLPKLLIKGGEHSGTMVALHIPKAVAKRLALPGGEAADSLHITLVYLGKGLSEQQKKAAASVVRRFAGGITDGIKATLGGVGRFSASESSEGRDVIYLSVDSPQLTKLRPRLIEMLNDAGVVFPENHGFSPHVTLTYIDKTSKTPLERFEPIEVKFDEVALSIGGKRMAFAMKLSRGNQQWIDLANRNAKVLRLFTMRKKLRDMYGVDLNEIGVEKALPRMSDEQREEKTKKVGAKAGKASAKKVGATGKTRYTYPGEKGGDKKSAATGASQPQQSGVDGGQQEQQDTLPHPDVPPPAPSQEPIAADHPTPPPANDPRAPDPTQPAQPKHTLNIGELCAALNIQRPVLQNIATRMQTNFKENARAKFTSFLETHLREFAQEHGLDGDYFGLLFDVLTGKVPEGQPSSAPKDQVAKPPGS